MSKELKRPKGEDYLFNQTVKYISDLNHYIDQLESKLKAVSSERFNKGFDDGWDGAESYHKLKKQ